MIQSVTLKRFKRFEDAAFTFGGRHAFLTGPNDAGKTTILQAIAAWSLAISRWRELNKFSRVKGYYAKAPITRQAFTAVPIQRFDLLWHNREYKGQMIVEIQSDGGWSVPMEFLSDTTEQIYVRPERGTNPLDLFKAGLDTTFAPPMSGLCRYEPLYAMPATTADFLGQAKPGDVLRNILVQASRNEGAWAALTRSMEKLFGYRLLPPDPGGAYIAAEFQVVENDTIFDLPNAGAGLLQALLLLAAIYSRPNSVLLIDCPEAHLDPELQKAVFKELSAAAGHQHSQVIMTTHSSTIIDAAVAQNYMAIRISNSH